jgi:hypothetical protein
MLPWTSDDFVLSFWSLLLISIRSGKRPTPYSIDIVLSIVRMNGYSLFEPSEQLKCKYVYTTYTGLIAH